MWKKLAIHTLILLLALTSVVACKQTGDSSTSDQDAVSDSSGRTRKKNARMRRVIQTVLGADEGSIVDSLSAQIDSEGNLFFAKLPSSYLEESGPRFVLKIRYNRTDRFPTTGLDLALNGIKSHPKGDSDLTSVVNWEQREDGWWLSIELTDLVFYPDETVRVKIRAIQKHRGKLKISMNAPSVPVAAKLFFLSKKPTVLFPRTLIDSIEPEGSPITSRSIVFTFNSADRADQFECAMDGYHFRRCQSPIQYQNLHLGHHRFSVRAISELHTRGPITSYVFKVKKAKGKLDITSVTPESSPTKSPTLTISFTKPANTSASCALDGELAQACSSPLTLSNLGEGSHTLIVSAGGDQVSHTWLVDQTAPVTAWQAAPEQLTRSSAADFSFSANETATFMCALDSAAFAPCTSPRRMTNLEDGSHEFQVIATDSAGNVSPAMSFRWTIDQTPPQVSITGVSPSQTVSNIPEKTISFTSSEAAHFRCILDGGASQVCSSPYQVGDLQDGAHQFTVAAMDLAGNISQSVSLSWQVDLTRPILTVNLLSPIQLPTSQSSASVEVYATESVEFRCSIDGISLSSCESPVSLSNLSDGAHVFAAQAFDEAGNQSDEASLEWAIDRRAPSLSFVSITPADAVTSSTSLQAEFESDEVASYTCELDGGGKMPCNSPWQLNALADGDHELSIIATDLAGNSSEPLTHSWAVVTRVTARIDSTNPSDAVTNQNSISISFSGAHANSFVCALDDGAFTACSSPALYNGLSDGEHFFVVRAVTAMGGIGEGDSHTWIVDATAPVVSLSGTTPNYSPTSRTSLTVSFAANESAQFSCSLDNGAASSCSSPHTITGLSSGSHTVRVYAVDTVGNTSSPASYTWEVNTAPLAVSDISITNITTTTAVISWTTNMPATTQVLYGQSSGFLDQATPVDSNLITSHSVTLTGLTPFTVYFVQAKSIDRDGREATSEVVNFRALR
jgi:large repetitive protein